MSFTLLDLAQKLGLEYNGEAGVTVNSVASLHEAAEGDVSYCGGKSYLKELRETKATVVILHPDYSSDFQGNAVYSQNPKLTFAQFIEILHPRPASTVGIHTTASVQQGASIDSTASIAENVVIEESVSIARGCQIGAGCFIGKNSVIGENTILEANVSIYQGTDIGSGCVLQSGCVIGSEGFGHVRDGEHWVAVPQIGNVVIGDSVSIGANTAIDRGALGDTRISNGVKIDNLVHIAHNVCVGENTAIAACVGIAGSTVIGKRCSFAGQVGVVDNITICDDAHFTGQAAVRADVLQPGVYSSGILLEEHGSWVKNAMRFKRLNDLFKQVRNLTKTQSK